ncbi:MAG: small subunit ribosomal protein S8 [archaeon GW2011_AR9]|nr:small subunit ribosomal protein S8 [uncultured archaeon]KHO50237.1 MAG: small subunit ribosomal protein S8 [archaeon GW2011_AR9]MBS3120276.1 30S ribosomal protein S8 [Candidatus Woesearchaeota archaeon]HIH12706.1 30S ribosomal protein S8 [Candidatus Woesearchaeota archaeon]
MLNDPLAAALTKVVNAERVGKREILIRPASSMIKKVLSIMNDHNYIGTYEEIPDGRGSVLKVNLLGNVNRCGVIKPRFSTKINQFEKWEKRYLPAHEFGIMVVSTPQGMMTHTQAKEKSIGGKLIAYCY